VANARDRIIAELVEDFIEGRVRHSSKKAFDLPAADGPIVDRNPFLVPAGIAWEPGLGRMKSGKIKRAPVNARRTRKRCIELCLTRLRRDQAVLAEKLRA
jgi:hypothetical protein